MTDADSKKLIGALENLHIDGVDLATINNLREVDDSYIALKKKMNEEIMAVKAAYRAKLAAFVQKRTDVLKEKSDVVPHFWREVLCNVHAIEEIEEYDVPILEHITDIRTEPLTEDDVAMNDGFKLIFEFSENRFFTNKTITKTYLTETINEYTDDLDIVEIQCDKILWKPRMCVFMEVVTKKVKQGRKGKGKTVQVEQKRPSFFRSFFRTLTPDMELSDTEAEDSDEEDSECEDDEFDKTQMVMEDDWEVGCVLRDCVIPHAIRWYTREALLDDSECEDESDEEDYEDSDDETPVKKNRNTKKKQHCCDSSDDDTPKGKKNKEECKQQ